MSFLPSTNRYREPAVPMKPAIDPAGWKPSELALNDDWIYQLSKNQCDQITTLLLKLRRVDKVLKMFAKAIFSLVTLQRSLPQFATNFSMAEGSF